MINSELDLLQPSVYYKAINSGGSSMPDLLMLPTIAIAEIDKQHKQLMECLELLELGVRKGYGLAAACAAILFLQDYIANYFHYEEDFLRSHSYPKLEEHIEEHRKIRAQVAIYTQQITDGCDLSSEICLLLREWIMKYVGMRDFAYATLLKSCAGLAPPLLATTDSSTTSSLAAHNAYDDVEAGPRIMRSGSTLG